MAKVGWIKLHRKIQECDYLWDSTDEPFDRRSAWIDLLLLANHEDKRTHFGGEGITIKAGQRLTSMRTLAERWHWSRERVKRYLDSLEKEGMVTRESDKHKTLITIVNYEVYQSDNATDESTNESTNESTDKSTDVATDLATNKSTDIATDEPHSSHTRATDEPQTSINKNDKNDKNEKNEKNEKEEKNINILPPLPPYQGVVDLYNEICVSYPRVQNLSNARKSAIKARFKTYDLNDFRLLFHKAEDSLFLKGGNKNNWVANFDWLIRDSNMAKVLDGNYDNKHPVTQMDAYASMLNDWLAEEGKR